MFARLFATLMLLMGVVARGADQLVELRAKAEQGDASAQYQLGQKCDNGTGVKQDFAEAALWYRKAAEQWHGPAMNNLGSLYQFGQGVSQDNDEAVRWYRKAAAQDYAPAFSNLGYMYDHGLGVPQDRAYAVKLYRFAAERGGEEGMLNLGVSYWRGEGIAKDLVQAYRWIDLARGTSHASGYVRTLKVARAAWFDLEREMSPKDIAAARRINEVWVKARNAVDDACKAAEKAEARNDFSQARDHYQRAYEIAHSRGLGPGHEAFPVYERARETGYLGRFEEAEQGFVQTLKLIEQADGFSDRLRTPTICEMARLFHDTGQDAKAVPIYGQALVALEKTGAEKTDPIAFAAFLDDYAASLKATGYQAQAQEIAARSDAIKLQNKGKATKFIARRYR
jgi:TPR repeat protein